MFYKVSVYQCLLHVVCGIYMLWLGLLAKLFGNGTLVVRCQDTATALQEDQNLGFVVG
jgi:hypothetical protein